MLAKEIVGGLTSVGMRGRGKFGGSSERAQGSWQHTVGRARLALAVIAVVVAGEEGGVNVDRVGDGLAETVSGEAHFGKSWMLFEIHGCCGTLGGRVRSEVGMELGWELDWSWSWKW